VRRGCVYLRVRRVVSGTADAVGSWAGRSNATCCIRFPHGITHSAVRFGGGNGVMRVWVAHDRRGADLVSGFPTAIAEPLEDFECSDGVRWLRLSMKE
jgi:hypothetical protein